MSVATKDMFSRGRSMLVATKLVATHTHTHVFDKHFCRDKGFVAESILLLRQKKDVFCRDKTRVCVDKTFVATKIILVAAPANDRLVGL